MRKIAIFVPDLALGGGQRVAMNMAEMFDQAGDTVHIVMMSDETPHFKTNLKIISLNCQKRDSFIGKLQTIFDRVKAFKALIKQEQYDVIVSFLESANLCAFLSDRKKSILTIHGNPIIFESFDRLMLQKILRFSPNLVTVSDGLKTILEQDHGLKNVAVIKNATDPVEIQQKAQLETYQHPRKFMVAAGRLADVKQFDVMIEAFYQTKAYQDPDNRYDLVIIGEGDSRPELEERIKANDDRVHLIGQKSNPFPVFAAADFYLMTSKTEAFPMVLLEALSLGKPILAYDCPTGVKEIVRHQVNGLLVDNQDFEGFVKAIDQMIYEPNLRQNLSANSEASVKAFTPETINKQWQGYFSELDVRNNVMLNTNNRER